MINSPSSILCNRRTPLSLSHNGNLRLSLSGCLCVRPSAMKEMVGGCCVCADERGWADNPLVYCDGASCTVAVHQACYGIVTVPTGAWYCRKCETLNNKKDVLAVRHRCTLCPSFDGAMKPVLGGGWAHVVCALYIPEVSFNNVNTMEPIQLSAVPSDRFNKRCYLCVRNERLEDAAVGACMTCNQKQCKLDFHVTCAQAAGFLCEEAGHSRNVLYCGYCEAHYHKAMAASASNKKGHAVKAIPPFKPIPSDAPEDVPPSLKDDISPECKKERREEAHDENKVNVWKAISQLRDTAGGGEEEVIIVEEIPHSLSLPPGDAAPIHIHDGTVTFEGTFENFIGGNSDGALETVSYSGRVVSPLTLTNIKNIPFVTSTPDKRKDKKKRKKNPIDLSKKSRNGGLVLNIQPNMNLTLKVSEQQPSAGIIAVTGGHVHQPVSPSRKRRHDNTSDVSPSIMSCNGLSSGSPCPSVVNISSGSSVSGGEHDPLPSPAGITVAAAGGSTGSSGSSGSSGGETSGGGGFMGPTFPRPAPTRPPNNNANSGSTFTSLEQLLERHWEQGSSFLMEQAQHFDIASLLSCLYQLKQENVRLESQVASLAQRREHHLAVNARLSVMLGNAGLRAPWQQQHDPLRDHPYPLPADSGEAPPPSYRTVMAAAHPTVGLSPSLLPGVRQLSPPSSHGAAAAVFGAPGMSSTDMQMRIQAQLTEYPQSPAIHHTAAAHVRAAMAASAEMATESPTKGSPT